MRGVYSEKLKGMKLSALIATLQAFQRKLGDVEVFTEYNDGRATFAEEPHPVVRHREIWKGHSAGKRYFIDL